MRPVGMDAMKAGAARLAAATRLEAATALTLATPPTGAADGGTPFMSAVVACAGTTGGWRSRGRPGREDAARVLTVNDVSVCEAASSHTGIQVDSIPVTQKGAVRTFVEHGPRVLARPPHRRQRHLHYPGRRPHQPLHRPAPPSKSPSPGCHAPRLGFPIWRLGPAVGAASGRSALRRRRGEDLETAALGLP